MKKLLLLTLCVAMATMMLAQTQKGYVKTKGRLGNDGQVIPGEPLSEVTIKVKDRNAVMSDKRGDFSFPMPDETFYLESVTKSGYVMIDPDLLSKQYSYSKNKLVIALETRENQLEERMDMNEKIMKAQKELIDKLRVEVKQLKAENKITEDEYYKRLQKIVDMQNENRQLVEDLVDHYSKIDYDDMNEFDRLFSSYLLNGDLRKADSLVNSKGDLSQRADEYYQLREANAKAREDLDMRKKKLEKSEAAEKKSRDELANLYYKKFEINKMKHQNDSAAYYLEERVKLDTTNLEWIKEFGEFIDIYLLKHDEALLLFDKGLQQAINMYGEQSNWCAIFNNHIGIVYSKIDDYIKALEYSNKALNIFIDNNYDDKGQIANCYKCIGVDYMKLSDFDRAKECFENGLKVGLEINDGNNLDVLGIYGNLGVLCDYLGYFDEALYYFEKTIIIGKYLFGDDDYILSNAYNNIGIIYDRKKDKEKAIENIEKSINIVQNFFGEDYPEVGYDYLNLGIVYRTIDRDKSRECLDKSLRILTGVYGENKSEVAFCYMTIGELYEDVDDYENALLYYNKSLEILKNIYGENNPIVANNYEHIGNVHMYSGNNEESLYYYEKALNIRQSLFGEIHYEVAYSYYNFGLLNKQTHNYTAASEWFNKAMIVFEKVYGEDHSTVVLCNEQLGEVYMELHDYKLSKTYYQKALDIITTVYGDDSPDAQELKSKISEVESKLAESKKKK